MATQEVRYIGSAHFSNKAQIELSTYINVVFDAKEIVELLLDALAHSPNATFPDEYLQKLKINLLDIATTGCPQRDGNVPSGLGKTTVGINYRYVGGKMREAPTARICSPNPRKSSDGF
jgi:hypothetical protein